MNNPDLVEVTIKVPPPPDGYEFIKGRLPEVGEPHYCYLHGQWEKVTGQSPMDEQMPLAFSRAKPKRLMTPGELAGKWIHMDYGCAHMVISIDMDENATLRIQAGTEWSNISQLHELGCTYSTTPDGERLPLETDAPPKAEGGQQ